MKLTKLQPTPPPPTFVLELSYREAYVLRAILECVGGHPNGPRAVAQDMIDALSTAGVQMGRGDMDLLDKVNHHRHAIHLLPNWPDRMAGL